MGFTAGSTLSEMLSAVRAGDVLVMRRTEPISQLIRWIDDSDPGHPVDVSHSMLVLSGGDDPEGFSVWPLADEPDRIVNDVVVAPLQALVRPYDRVLVLRHRELEGLSEDQSDQRVAGIVERARGFYAEGQRGAIAFNDMQLYAKALTFIEPHIDGPGGWMAKKVLRRLASEVRSGGAREVICPELIMRAFNTGDDALPITTSPVLPPPLLTELLAPDEDLSDVAWNSFKRELMVGACAIAVELLIRRPLAPPPSRPAPPDQMIEYTSPGDLLRSDDLVLVGCWQSWTGRIEDARSLPGGREAVKQERMAGPGVPDPAGD